MCVGFHAKAGAGGILSHSFMCHEIEDMWLDGRPVGEIGLVHAAAAALGAPVVVEDLDDALETPGAKEVIDSGEAHDAASDVL
ncbi:MAG TPA: M55 family metallopeptidase [Pseudonocardia sp.]|jgi:D-amino peptidase|uniref:M55 family metallopeptidase n=1 Tax=Pseudonocardia sp. TaxID=60912 RepID=UPI002C323704|nr:M55 family metallopeptidase [Pseudonocardia sp.]HTF54689.1 M55 family metallopeptidase [Pseudonocardia sp.]